MSNPRKKEEVDKTSIERALRESEQKFEKIFHNSSTIIAISTIEEGLYIDVNESFLKRLGFEKEDVLGKTSTDLNIWVNPEERDKIIQIFSEKKHIKNIEVAIRTKSGEIIDGLFSADLVDIKNRPLLITMMQDITDRKKTEEKLMESEEKFRTIAEQLLMGIVIIQGDMVKYANQRMGDLFGYSNEEIMNWEPGGFTKLFAPDSLEFVLDQAKKKQSGLANQTIQYPIHCIKKSGDLFWVENYSKTILYNGSSADLITIIDITERKKAEESLKESEKRYREAFERANMYKDLISHDMNNIIGAIQGSVELCTLLQNSPEDIKKKAELMEIVSMSTHKAKKLVSNVQTLSKIEEGIDTSLVNVDILNLIKEAIKFTQASFQNREIKINIDERTNTINVQANDLLLDVFENILNNAVKYNDNPIVEINIRISKDRVGNIKIEFIDNGLGITDERKKYIFQKGHDDLKGGRGLGFGLSVVKKVIAGYQGKLLVEDRINGDYSKGSNFIIILPIYPRAHSRLHR